jgi:hypothetical protein
MQTFVLKISFSRSLFFVDNYIHFILKKNFAILLIRIPS